MAKTKKKEKIKGLNAKQTAFVREYVVDWNATRAYKTAYDSSSDKVAGVSGHKLLKNPRIQTYIKEIQENLEELAGVSRLRVLREFMKIGFSSIGSFHKGWMERAEFDQLTDEELACIGEIKNEKIQGDGWDKEVVKIKLYDKQKALENINKMMGYNIPEESTLNIIHQITGMKIT